MKRERDVFRHEKACRAYTSKVMVVATIEALNVKSTIEELIKKLQNEYYNIH